MDVCSKVKFQFALPRGERLNAPQAALFDLLFQFALPRGERRPGDSRARRDGRFNSRSREGSDFGGTGDLGLVIVSIRAPARGATVEYRVGVQLIEVSIRAPARGAT